MKLPQIRDAGPGSTGMTSESAYAGSITPLVFCTIFLLGRAYSRLFILESWGQDDTWIVIAWLATIVAVALFCIEVSYGPAPAIKGYIVSYAAIVCYQVGVSLTKVSVLFFYLRILPRGKYRLFTWVTLGFVICSSISLVVASVLPCSPVSGKYYYNPRIACVPVLPLLYTGAVFNGFTDAWLIAFIIPCIIGLQLPLRQKMALVVVMSAGVLVIIAGIVRAYYIAESMMKPLGQWNVPLFGIWTSVELCIGIFCASAPATLPLLRQIAPRAMDSLTGRTHQSNGYSKDSGGKTRMRRREGSIELHTRQGQPVIRSAAKASKSISQLKSGWYSSQHDPSESQEDVLANSGSAGIIKTSEVVVSETRLDSDEDLPDSENGKARAS